MKLTPSDTASNPHPITAKLTAQERLLLFCLASGGDWQAASIEHATVQYMVMRGLIQRAGGTTSYKLTDQGRAALDAMLAGDQS